MRLTNVIKRKIVKQDRAADAARCKDDTNGQALRQ